MMNKEKMTWLEEAETKLRVRKITAEKNPKSQNNLNSINVQNN